MQRALIIIYTFVTAIIAALTSILEVQPAKFFIDWIAPNSGEVYNLVFIILATWLLFMIPLTLVLIIARLSRSSSYEEIPKGAGVFITRQKALQSALVGIPVYINGDKVGNIDNGKTKFYPTPLGPFTIQIGNGKLASIVLEDTLKKNEQLRFVCTMKEEGISAKIHLSKIEEG